MDHQRTCSESELKLNQKVYLTNGYNTVSLGSGRSEFHPAKPRPGLLHYIKEAGQAVLQQLEDPSVVDEGIISNFMAARFNKQGHLAAFLPAIDSALKHKPSTRVEAACASGGVALYTGIKSVLSGVSDVVLCLGVEVQNSVKALYGADYLAGAAYFEGMRKNGHAFFFPDLFSRRAGAYAEKYGVEATRLAMATWYRQAIENARREPKAQEYENKIEDLMKVGLKKPSGNVFLDHLNFCDCSKVSDGASAALLVSEEGLKKINCTKDDAVEIVALGQCEGDLTMDPDDLTSLSTTRASVNEAFTGLGLSHEDLSLLECHDCFSITGILALEALGVAESGGAKDLVASGYTAHGGTLPVNTTGGLMGFGHYTGGTGIRQAVDLWRQLTGQADEAQISLRSEFGMMINMGGNDKTVTSLIFKK